MTRDVERPAGDGRGKRRAWRLVLGAIASVLLAAIVAAGALSSRSVRERFLPAVLDRVEAALPGTWEIAGARWPAIGRLSVERVRWQREDAVLLSLRDLDVDVDLAALWRRDVHVRLLRADSLAIDLPAIGSAFGADPAATPPARGTKSGAFLRPGSVPFLPSVGVDTIAVTASHVKLSPDRALTDVRVQGGVELRAGLPPAVALTTLEARVPADGVAIAGGSATWDPRAPLALRANVRGNLADDVPFALDATSDETGTFVVTADVGQDRPPVVALRGTLRRKGDLVSGAAGTATFDVPDSKELARIPFLRPWLERAPEFGAAEITARGDVAWGENARGDFQVDLSPGPWIRRGVAHVRFSPGEMAVDSLDVAIEGLTLTGEWRRVAERDSARVTAKVSSADWLRPFVAAESLPQKLDATLVANLRGPTSAPQLDARLDARATVGDVVLDQVAVRGAGGVDLAEGLRTAFVARSQGWGVRGAARVFREEDGSTRVETSPLRVRRDPQEVTAARDLDLPAEIRGGGSVIWDGATATLDRLRVDGDLGPIDVSGRLRDGRGPFEVRGRWKELPRELETIFAADSTQVAARWTAAGPFDVSLRGELDRTSAGEPRVRGDATWHLPGPWVVVPGDSTRASLEGTETIAGNGTFAWSPAGGDATIDLSATSWLDEFRVMASGAGSEWRADSAIVRAPGFTLRGSGGVTGDSLMAFGRLEVLGSGIVSRFVPQLADSASRVSLESDFRVGGTPAVPVVEAPIVASVTLPGFDAPRVLGTLRYRGGDVELEGHAEEPVSTEYARWDELEFFASQSSGTEGASPEGRFSFRLQGSESGGEASATWSKTSEELRLNVTNLAGRFLERDLATTSPFTATFRPSSRAFALENAHLAGSMGTLDADIALSPDETDLDVTLDLDVGHLPWNPGLPAGLWPLRLRAVAKGTAADSLSLDVTAEGLRIGPEKDATLRATLREAARGTSAEIRLESDGRALVAADGSLPWVVTRDPLAFSPTDDGLDLRVTLDRFPLPEFLADPLGTPGYLDRGDATRAPRLAGHARIAGSPNAPEGVLRGSVTFPAYDELAHYSVGIEARAAQDSDRGGDGAGADSTVRVSASLLAMKPGLAARLSARRDSVEILDADLALPFEGAWNEADPADRELSFHARAEDLALDDLTPLFPGVLGLDGRVRLDVSAEGPLDDPRLAGDIDLENVEVRLRDRSWATARGNVHLAGSGRAPNVTGRIVVPSGSIRVPETPPTLYPTEGTALLWAQEEEFAAEPPNDAAPDSAGATIAADSSAPPDSTPAPPADATKLDVTVTVPSGVRLQGRGLDVELGGELEILRSGNEMSLVGSLDAQRGSMQYLGRRLEIESGTVTFYGSKDLNPTLNLSLAKQSGTVTVRVIVTGTLLKPRLELRSDPDMSQGDILAFLLFDRTSDTLTGEQTQRLSEQARSSAEQFAANRLAEELGQELGVDVLRYEQSASDSVQTRTITVGKYLSPDLLVQYEQGLENREGIGLVVEYFLGHGLRLEMRSHRQDQDGLVLGWERNY